MWALYEEVRRFCDQGLLADAFKSTSRVTFPQAYINAFLLNDIRVGNTIMRLSSNYKSWNIIKKEGKGEAEAGEVGIKTMAAEQGADKEEIKTNKEGGGWWGKGNGGILQ